MEVCPLSHIGRPNDMWLDHTMLRAINERTRIAFPFFALVVCSQRYRNKRCRIAIDCKRCRIAADIIREKDGLRHLMKTAYAQYV